MTPRHESGFINRNAAVAFVASLAVVVFLGLFLRDKPGGPGGATGPLLVYCAAGIKPPVVEAAQAYEEAYGVSVELQYGGSGTLLSNLTVARKGDLYLPADSSYIARARDKGLVAEAIPLADMRPVIGVKAGNPKNIRSVDDLLRSDVVVCLANESAAVGKASRDVLEKMGKWEAIKARVKVFKPTVGEVANALKAADIDAAIIWDATAHQYAAIDMVSQPELDQAPGRVTIGVLTSSEQPTAALQFARYLGARDRGLLAFEKHRYAPVDGDVWAESPKVVLFSGGVNRVAIAETLLAFGQREGVTVDTEYNGCGILTASMKAIKTGDDTNAFPDAYFACDVSFMDNVKDFFLDSLDVSETDMVILVQKDNPQSIKTLRDLGKPGVRVGVANAKQSALGALTDRLLGEIGAKEIVLPNVKTRTPTADLLVNAVQTGALDAAVVYEANTAKVKDVLEVIRIDHPSARAVQPYAISKDSENKYLLGRLLDAITSQNSRRQYESVGFDFLAGTEAP